MDIVLKIVLAVVVIGYFVGFASSARTFRWYHLTFMGLVFIMTLVFAVHVAMVLKTRKAWGELVKSYEKQLEPLQAEHERLLGRDVTAAADPMSTYLGAKSAVERTLVGRGRVWRRCAKVGADQARGTVLLQTQAAAPAVPVVDPTAPAAVPAPAAEGPGHGIAEKAVVYAFTERALPDGSLVPDIYLGEYETVAVTNNTVTLKPLLPLDPQQIQIIISGGATWTLYEKIPTDSHFAFDEYFDLRKAQRDEATLADMVKRVPGTSDAGYAKVIQDYMRDGKAPLADDPPERVWVKVKFLKPYEVPVDSPSTQVRLDSEFYDINGLALMPGLRREEPVKFNKDDFATIHQSKADELVNEGIVEKVESVYRRPLHDFKHHYREIFLRTELLTDRLAEVQRQLTAVIDSQKKVQAQIDYRTIEKSKLEEDLTRHKAELAAVTEYEQKLDAGVTAVRNRANQLFQANIVLVDEIAAMQAQMASEINERTRQAVGPQGN